MPYASAQDIINRYPAKDLQELTSEDGQSIDQAALTRALADASDEIDGYLMARYPLPLANPPRVLTLYACQVAMYRLAQLRPQTDVEDLRKRYDDAIAFFKSVAAGDVALGLGANDTTSASAADALVQAPPRTFSRDTMRGF